jgi:hypothetical protein
MIAMRPLRMFGLAVVFAFTAIVIPAGSLSVLAKCDPNRPDDTKSYWTGWYRYPGTTTGGVGSDILNYSPWVHWNDDSVLAWTMVAKSPLYAQVGWIEFAGSFRYTFTEYTTSDGNWHRKLFSAYSIGSVHRYTTLFGNKPGQFSMWIDGVDRDDEPAQFTPNHGENFGEIHTLDDQMPGGYNSHETFRNTQIYYSGAWHAFAGTGSINPPGPFHYSTSDSGQYKLDIWDAACSS